MSDPTSGVHGTAIAVDGGAAAPLGTEQRGLKGDGPHTVTVRAKDAAGNLRTTTATFASTPPRRSSSCPGRGYRGHRAHREPQRRRRRREHRRSPSPCEPGKVTAVITDAAGATVRTLSRHRRRRAPGRAGTGGPPPESRPGRPLHGHVHAARRGRQHRRAGPAEADVYAALSTITRTPTALLPPGRGPLARSPSRPSRSSHPPSCHPRVVDATGMVVRIGLDRPFPAAGPASWAWNGMLDDGTLAPPRRLPDRGRRHQRHPGRHASAPVRADAFRLTTSTATATRGRPPSPSPP